MKRNLILIGLTLLFLGIGWRWQAEFLLWVGVGTFLIFLITFFIKRIIACLTIGFIFLIFLMVVLGFVFVKYLRPGAPYGIDKRQAPTIALTANVFEERIEGFRRVTAYSIEEFKGFKFNFPALMAIYEKEGKRLKVVAVTFKDPQESASAVIGFSRHLSSLKFYSTSLRYGLGNWERRILGEPLLPATILRWRNSETKEAGIMWNNRAWCFIVSDTDKATAEQFVQHFPY